VHRAARREIATGELVGHAWQRLEARDVVGAKGGRLRRGKAHHQLGVVRDQGQALLLLLGNSGPSIARNVKMVFDPAPPSTLDTKPILEILKQGIASLAPGRTKQWALGAPHNGKRLGCPHRVPGTIAPDMRASRSIQV
jgi:hypothetical protein